MSPTIWIPILIGFFIIAPIIKYNDDGTILPSNFNDFSDSYLPITMMLGIIGLSIWALLGISTDIADTKIIEKRKHELISLKDGFGMEGRFSFLGSGYIDGGLRYYGRKKLTENSHKAIKFPLDVIIHEIDGNSAYFIENVEVRNKDHWTWRWRKWMMGPFEYEETQSYEIFIPKGSVIDKGKYEVDLE